MSTMDVFWQIDRINQRPLNSTITVPTTDNIAKVVKKVYDENRLQLSAVAAPGLVAKHWESMEDQSTISITKKAFMSAIDEEIAATHILVIEDAPPSVAPVVATPQSAPLPYRSMYEAACNLNHLHLFSVSLNDRYELDELKPIPWDGNRFGRTEHFRIWRWADNHVRWPHTTSFSPSEKGQNTFFVRPCYVDLYDTVWKEVNSRDRPTVAVVTGTPGTGKTSFQVYLLQRFLCLQQVDDFVIILDAFGCFLKFQRGCEPELGLRESFRTELQLESTVYLFDANKDASSKPLLPSLVRCRGIITTSPNRNHLNEYVSHPRFHMPPWSLVELHLARQCWFVSHDVLPQPTEAVSREIFEQAYEYWGGNARHCLALADQWMLEFQSAANSINSHNHQSLLNFVGTANDVLLKDDLALVHRALSVIPITADFKKFRIEFASRHFHTAVVQSLVHADVAFLRSLASSSNTSTLIRSAAFEAYAHNRLSSGGQFFVRSLPAGGWSTVSFPPRFSYIFSSFKDALDHWADSGSSFYFRPEASNHPVADSYIFPSTLLQMTISLDHGIVAARLTEQLNLIESTLDRIVADAANSPDAGVVAQWAQDAWRAMRIVFVVPAEIADDFRLQRFTNIDLTQRVRGTPVIAQWVMKLDTNDIRATSMTQ